MQSENYSEADLARFREEFRLEAARVTKLRRVMAIAIITFFILAVSVFALGGMPSTAGIAHAVIPLASLSFAVALVSLFWQRRLACPGCRQRLFDRFGPFCPECGSRALGVPDPCDLVPIHPCAACGQRFRWGNGAKLFRLHFCSHCGMFLHEHGLEMP